ncbi:NAD-dependent epimerase/dehydratase family protein [Bremerella alba]|uniref:GDP-6-deoxy-D-mannose reductase n=1 Tax=Bremerella alba TaxID=980252 RepID=A0A7V8V1P6_9BACT|nr:NAD-dependent epimerase/dehydratase family protein [Bremerella alba]MBA2113323.1 GDP-6-deoxy-D-mannose reductase [Bremerella alba]
MNSLITGINGFVGQHLASYLRSCGDDVRGTYVGSQPSSDLDLKWEISQPASPTLIDTLKEFSPDVIYHLAAISHPGSCGDDLPTETCKAVNILGTRHVADLALSLPSEPRVIFTSSSKVYGGRTQEQPWAKEDDTLQPHGGYAHSKWAGENLLRDRIDQGLKAIIARAFNHTGPGQSPIYLVPEWCEKIRDADGPQSVRSLTTSLDLSDVRDVVRIYRLLAQKGSLGESYNVGSGQAITTADIWNTLCDISGKQVEVTAEKPGPSQQPIADVSKLHEAIGSIERITLRQTLEDVFQD